MARCNCGTTAPATPVAFAVAPESGLTQKGVGHPDDPVLLGTDTRILSRGFQGSEAYRTPGTHSFRIGDYQDAKWVRVRCVGGGGGGAGATAVAPLGVARGGGSGGNYSEAWLDASSLIPTVTVSVGYGGAGGDADNGHGGDGEQTSFGTYVVATGGLGAKASALPTEGPQVDAGAMIPPYGQGAGQILAPGSAGVPGHQIATGCATGGMGGMGGDGLGTGGPGGVAYGGVVVAPLPGYPFGGGGGGAVSAVGEAAPGGAGGPGGVLVEVFS